MASWTPAQTLKFYQKEAFGCELSVRFVRAVVGNPTRCPFPRRSKLLDGKQGLLVSAVWN